MKKIIVLAIILAVLIPAAAWAGEKFSAAEKAEISQVAARVFHGARVDFSAAENDDGGISIGPLRDGKYLFIRLNFDSEIINYPVPIEYDQPVYQILRTMWGIIDNRSASDY